MVISGEDLKVVYNVITESINIDIKSINDQLSAKDVESWDSLAQISILEGLEESFDITISDDELIELISVASILRLVETRFL